MMAAIKQKLFIFANSLAVFAALLALWQLILWIFRVPPFMLPSPLPLPGSASIPLL